MRERFAADRLAVMLDSAARPPLAVRPGRTRARGLVTAWLRRNLHAVIASSLYACVLFLLAGHEVVGDTWAAVTGGRDIVEHGLPWHERLTLLDRGVGWVDQQWLGKVFLFGLLRLGGVRLLLLVHVAFVVGAFVAAVAVARRRGASDQAVFWVGAATFLVAPWAWQVRTQSLSYVLFVAVVALLAADSRRETPWVFLSVPLLAVWANVHGSVTLGVALAALAGVLRLRRRPVRGALLACAAPLAVFASPYGFHLVAYYRTMLFNPLLEHYVTEWRAPTAPSMALPFFASAAAAVWLLARHRRVLTRFEEGVLLMTSLLGLDAIRGIVWFALAAAMLVPRLLDAEAESMRATAPRFGAPLAAACCSAAVAAALYGPAALPRSLASAYPDGAVLAVQRAEARDPTLRVFASERYADWLLWRAPSVGGRLVSDVRFDRFTSRQFEALSLFHGGRDEPRWPDVTDGARLFVLDRTTDAAPAGRLESKPGARVLFEDRSAVVVLERP